MLSYPWRYKFLTTASFSTRKAQDLQWENSSGALVSLGTIQGWLSAESGRVMVNASSARSCILWSDWSQEIFPQWKTHHTYTLLTYFSHFSDDVALTLWLQNNRPCSIPSGLINCTLEFCEYIVSVLWIALFICLQLRKVNREVKRYNCLLAEQNLLTWTLAAFRMTSDERLSDTYLYACVL